MKPKIFIGSKNKAKIRDWSGYLNKFEVVSPHDLGLGDIIIDEISDTIVQNSIEKAVGWAKHSNLVTFSDDSGFFINELNGIPGVEAKTWGKQLPEDRTDRDYLEYVQKQIFSLKNTACFFETAVTVYNPITQKTITLTDKLFCTISKELFANLDTIDAGYPLGSVIIPNGKSVSWNALSQEEKDEIDRHFYLKVSEAVEKIMRDGM